MKNPARPKDSGLRIATYWVVILVLFALLFEVIGFAAAFMDLDAFDHRETAIARLGERQTADLRKVDPVVGWQPVPGAQLEDISCLGVKRMHQIAADGARSYPGYEPGEATIVVSGDSYTYGAEVADTDAFPAVLAGLAKEQVANLGVGGYGPVQAVLRLEEKIDNYPKARMIVLGIMYENVHRMMNAYRPVLYDKMPIFAFAPFMRDGQVQPHIGKAPLMSDETLLPEIERAFDTDFWAKPRHRFPYSVALYKGLSSNFFQLRRVQKTLRKLGQPEYVMTFASPVIQENLFGLLDRFAALAKSRDLDAVVMFMPRNRLDIQSVQTLIAENSQRFPDGLRVLDVATADLDWSRYNLENTEDGNICHPSEYGYEKIARHLAESMVPGPVADARSTGWRLGAIARLTGHSRAMHSPASDGSKEPR